MKTLRRRWTEFRTLPGIVQFGAGLALAILLLVVMPAAAQTTIEVEVQTLCSPDGKLVALRIAVPAMPAPGVITLSIPPDVCAGTQPAPARQPARST